MSMFGELRIESSRVGSDDEEEEIEQVKMYILIFF